MGENSDLEYLEKTIMFSPNKSYFLRTRKVDKPMLLRKSYC